MAFQTFTWRVVGDAMGTYTPAILSAQFGDGLEATALDGPRLQALRTRWPITVVGSRDEVQRVHDFLADNMARRFVWTDPFTGKRRLWRCKSWSAAHKGGPTWTLAGEFAYAGELPA